MIIKFQGILAPNHPGVDGPDVHPAPGVDGPDMHPAPGVDGSDMHPQQILAN